MIVVVCVREPLTPVAVSVYVPAGVLATAVTVKVDDVVAGFGVKDAVAPLGKPSTLRVTWLLKPPTGVIVIP